MREIVHLCCFVSLYLLKGHLSYKGTLLRLGKDVKFLQPLQRGFWPHKMLGFVGCCDENVINIAACTGYALQHLVHNGLK